MSEEERNPIRVKTKDKNQENENPKNVIKPLPKDDDSKNSSKRHDLNWWEMTQYSTDRLMSQHTLVYTKKKNVRSNNRNKRFRDSMMDKNSENKKKSPAKYNDDTKDKKSNEEKTQLIILDAPSPPIWTTGTAIILLIVLICELIQQGGITLPEINPMIGPGQEVYLTMGAKYGPLILSGEWWRFFTAIYVHVGIVTFAINVIVLLLNINVEKTGGFLRASVVFIFSGVYGFILSAFFDPLYVSAGVNGAAYGYISINLCDILSSWKKHNNGWKNLGILLVQIFFTLLFGFTPFYDNYLNLGGFIIGVLFALMLLPNMNFKHIEKIAKGVIAFLAFPTMTVIFALTLVTFFRSTKSGYAWCKWCTYLNCVNISGWCGNSLKYDITVHTWN